MPHTLAIIFTMILLCAVLTWILPAGEFDRTTVSVDGIERSVLVPGSYHKVERAPQTWQVLGALIFGFEAQAAIIAFILVIGGAFQILNSSRAVDRGILSFLNWLRRWERIPWIRRIGVDPLVIAVIIILFSLFGGVFGMSEETLAFVVIVVPLAISMGYDSITGFAMVYVAAHVGFSGAMFNPFTIGIAQGLSGLPLFSGVGYRVFCWALLTIVCIVLVLWYANRVKKNPKRSPMYALDQYWRNRVAQTHTDLEVEKSGEERRTTRGAYFAYALVVLVMAAWLFIGCAFRTIGWSEAILCTVFVVGGLWIVRRSYHSFILWLLAYTIFFLILGVLKYHWYIPEIAALFLAMGLLTGMSMGAKTGEVISAFMEGAKDLLTAALVVGMAGGIIYILQQGHILDTMLYGLGNLLGNTTPLVALLGVYLIMAAINILIPSGSAKAALLMPIFAPFADVVGLSRQAVVTAFQFGDGFTNMITPVSAVLIGALAMARIPYSVWIRHGWKMVVLFLILGALLLVPTVYLSLDGF